MNNSTNPTPATPPYTWELVGRPEPRGKGQRFFRRSDRPDAIYVADNSGRNPDRTEDGPLRLDLDKPLRLGAYEGRPHITASVHGERHGQGSNVGLTAREAGWLVEEHEFRVEAVPAVARTLKTWALLAGRALEGEGDRAARKGTL